MLPLGRRSCPVGVPGVLVTHLLTHPLRAGAGGAGGRTAGPTLLPPGTVSKSQRG